MEEQFDQFVQAHGVDLLRYAHLLCGEPHRAEDLVQDALAKLHRAWRRSGPPAAPVAYTRRIVTNEYLGWRRRRSSHELPGEVPERPGGGDPADAVVARDWVMRTIRELPARQRAVLVMRYFEDLPDSEIATTLGVAEGTVRSLAARAFSSLRESIPVEGATHG